MLLSKLASADISWWMRNALTSKKGIHHRKTTHTFYTHTSTKGCVQTWMTPQLGEWSSSEESHHIYYLELNAILLGFSPRKNDKSLLTIGGAKDLGALRSGDTVRLVPPGNPSKEAVKAKVEGVLELDPLRWLPKMEPDIIEITVTWGKQRRPAGVQDLLWWPEGGIEQPDQQLTSSPEQAQTGHEVSNNLPSGQVDATNGHAMASQQPEPLVQPSGLSVQGPTMQTGRCCFRNLFSSLFCLHNYYSLTICTFSKFLLFMLWLLWSMQVLQYNLWNHVIRDTTFFISLVAPSTFSLFTLSLSPLSF